MNALTYVRPSKGKYILAGKTDADGAYKIVDKEDLNIDFQRLYLADMSADETVTESIADRVFEGKSRVMISVSRTLEEVGAFDKKYGLSPVMYLHKLGLLERVDALVGGVWLDRDDVDIMAQCGCPLIITPSYDMGTGNGIPETATYLRRGLTLGIGTENCAYNPACDMRFETKLIELTASATMRESGIITEKEIKKMLDFSLKE